MADSKITALTADTSPSSDDLIVTVNDPSGTPANRKVTLANAITKAHGLSDGIVKISSGVATIATAGTDYSAIGYQTATGTVNGSNTSFTFAVAPNVISVDGVILRKTASDTTANWTGTTTITLLIAPNFDIFGVA
jgi:hypothetical protein